MIKQNMLVWIHYGISGIIFSSDFFKPLTRKLTEHVCKDKQTGLGMNISYHCF